MSAETAPEFTWREGLIFLLAFVAIQLGSETINQWGLFFYTPTEGTGRITYVGIGIVGYMFIIGTCWDALSGPFIGTWSDRTPAKPGRWRIIPIPGRRRPFIFWGSILLVFTFVGIWYPPVPGTSWVNFVYGAVMICLHWTVFNLTTLPILALGPEIARSEKARVRLGLWIAGGFIAGLAIANALTGEFVLFFSSAPPGEPASPSAYRAVSVAYAILMLALFQLAAWGLRERYTDTPEESAAPVLEGYRDALRNLPFVLYFMAFFLFTSGFLAVQRVLVHWAELGLHGDEGTVTLLLGPYILGAVIALALASPLADRIGLKWSIMLSLFILTTSLPWMYVIGTMEATPQFKVFCGGALFFYSGLGQGILYVVMTPVLGEIIDYDAARSGHRREALYNGLNSVAWKASMAVAAFIATQSMSRWGASVENPLGVYLVGPIAGLCGLLGLVVMFFYPRSASKVKVE